MNVSPRVPPVGSDQWRRVRGCVPDGKTMQDGEEEHQHGVPHSWSFGDVHPGGFHWEMLEVLRGSVVPKFVDGTFLNPSERHSCTHPLLGKKAKQSPPKMCGLLERKGHFHLSVFIPELLVTLVFLVTHLASSTLKCLIIIWFRMSFRPGNYCAII